MTENQDAKRDSERPATDLDLLLQKAKEFHDEICAGIVLGTRMTMIGMRELGMNPLKKNRNLIVYVEIDRCIADAIQAITSLFARPPHAEVPAVRKVRGYLRGP